jgi:DNA uptake protein ComE-like DNA-binding protein
MKQFTSHFWYNKSQRNGIFLLAILIVFFQILIFTDVFSSDEKITTNTPEILTFQQQIDSLKIVEIENRKPKIYPFNPNFITDFKGYKLGMTVEQIDRLLAFRKQGKFANSAKEFQQVTGVSDSLLNVISPYFKFPDWVNKKNAQPKSNWVDYSKSKPAVKQKVMVLDINSASKEDLMKVYGIGDAISDRILKQKELLGCYVSMEQMEDVWGLSPEVIEKLNQQFAVQSNPNPKRIKINEASIKELGQFPYFRYPISKSIVTYRSMNGDLKIEDLTKIKGLPIDKIKIIALYLEF